MTTNRQVVLTSRPIGIPQAEHFDIVSSPLPSVGPGEVLVRHDYLSVDPAMRGWVNTAANYSEPVAIGAVMRSFAAGTVLESRHEGHAVGDRVMGLLGWQEFSVTSGDAIIRTVPDDGLPLSLSLGVLGLNGVTAWFGVTDILRRQPGDTVVVSTAAGAVGSAAGQIAKAMGCRTVGIAGGPVKTGICADEFGFDAAVDYRSPTFEQDLRAACDGGVDGYFDNTSGRVSDAVMPLLNTRASVLVCGTASVTSWDPVPTGPRIERVLLTKRARIEGILAFDYEHRFDEATERLAALIASNRLHYREQISEGLEEAPGAIAGLYAGENYGKRIIQLAH